MPAPWWSGSTSTSYALTFGLGAAWRAAGCIMVLLVDVTPPLGPAYTLLAFVIVITGGLGSMPGALLGGVLIGVTEALGACSSRRRPRACSPSDCWYWCCCSARRAFSARARHERAGGARAALILLGLLAVLMGLPLVVNDYPYRPDPHSVSPTSARPRTS
jgi:ABC-type branched-subunit amino acid transport system permease subunit